MNAQPQPIRRSDLEAKMRELQGEVTETRQSATHTLATIGAVLVVGAIAVAFVLGRRNGRRRMTVVEVRRI